MARSGALAYMATGDSSRAGTSKPVPDRSPFGACRRFLDQNFIAAGCVQRAQVGIQISRIALRIGGGPDPHCALLARRSRAETQHCAVLPRASLPLLTRDEP